MPKRIDLVGQRFGRLTVISFFKGGNDAIWTCKCDCGNTKQVSRKYLAQGNTKSCGCLRIQLGKQIDMASIRDKFIVLMKERKVKKESSAKFIKAKKLIEQKRKLRYHGLTNHPLYLCWCNMRRRCYDISRKDYKQYGGRGIKVCDKWLTFKHFYDDMLSYGWSEGLTIDRIDVNDHYKPGNVRWVTWKEQAGNRRLNQKIDETV